MCFDEEPQPSCRNRLFAMFHAWVDEEDKVKFHPFQVHLEFAV